MSPAKIEALKNFIRAQGGEVEESTNTWEIVRFRARGGVHSIYTNARGRITAHGFSGEVLAAFNKPIGIAMGNTKKQRPGMAGRRSRILERDGNVCFYCLQGMGPEDRTVEHLIDRSKGGPDHLDNLVLAHEQCNLGLNGKNLHEKLAVREKALREEWEKNEKARQLTKELTG